MAEAERKLIPSRGHVGEVAKRIFRHETMVLALVLAGLIVAVAGITKGKSVSAGNMINVLVQSSARGMAAIGQTFVVLTAGIDLTPTGLALMAIMVGALMMSRGGEVGGLPLYTGPALPLGLGLLIMLGIGVGVGAANGSLVSRVGVPPLIATLAMWQMTFGFATILMMSRRDAGFGISGLPKGLAFFGLGHIGVVPLPVIIFAVSMVVAYFILNHTPFGRSIYAVGGNPASAWLSGIKARDVVFWVYVISGFTTILAGIIIMSRAMSASLLTVVGLELDSIAAVCVGGVSLAGGTGSIIGTLIGVLIIGVINNGLNLISVAAGVRDAVKGGIIVTAVAINTLRRRRG